MHIRLPVWPGGVIKTSSVAAGFGRHGMPRPSVTLTFDRLTLKLVCESHLRSHLTFFPNLGSRIIRYVRDAQTDGQTLRLVPSSLRAGTTKQRLFGQ